MQAVLYFICLETGSNGVAVGEVCSFDGVELWEWGVQQYFGLSALVELYIYIYLLLFIIMFVLSRSDMVSAEGSLQAECDAPDLSAKQATSP